MQTVLISACLLGLQTQYNGKDCLEKPICQWLKEHQIVAIPMCPEQLGGFPTPRLPMEIVGGDGNAVLEGKARVINQSGQDVTEYFFKATQEVIKMARFYHPRLIILKSRSPSCGVQQTYDGSFTNTLVPGQGVITAFLRREGFSCCDETQFFSPQFQHFFECT